MSQKSSVMQLPQCVPKALTSDTTEKSQIVDLRHGLPKLEQRVSNPIRPGLEHKDAVVFEYPGLQDDLLSERRVRTIEKGIHVMVIANVHQRMPSITQYHATRRSFEKVDRIAIGKG